MEPCPRPHVSLRARNYHDLRGARIVMITAGTNEKTGGAIDREDPAGRLRLPATHATIYKDIVPRIVAAAPDALLLVVTDPPDSLADVARRVAGQSRPEQRHVLGLLALSLSSRREARGRSELGAGSGHW